MNEVAEQAAETLRGHHHPALRLDELCELLRERVDRNLTCDRLHLLLADHPDDFRILESWKRRWSRTETLDRASAWVLAIDKAGPPDPGGPWHPGLCLRESVRWLGRRVDGRSAMDVSRWYAIVLSERAARRALVTRELGDLDGPARHCDPATRERAA